MDELETGQVNADEHELVIDVEELESFTIPCIPMPIDGCFPGTGPIKPLWWWHI